MKTIDSDNESTFHTNSCNDSEEVTDLLISEGKGGHNLLKCNSDLIQSYNILKSTPTGHKNGFYQRVLCKNGDGEDTRSQSMPNCLDNKHDCDNCSLTDNCDIKFKLLTHHDSPPHSPTNELWFKTWPERYDKLKSDTNPTSTTNTQLRSTTCDKAFDISSINNKITLDEALQNISLAYSPVTKQLHILSKQECVSTCDIEEDANTNPAKKSNDNLINEGSVSLDNELNQGTEELNKKRYGHKRNEAGSFSSTISSLSDPSPSGSLLDAEDRSITSDDSDCKSRKKSFSSFFSRNVFSWKSHNNNNNNLGGWKIFNKPSDIAHTSPQHTNCEGIVASSSALIQHIRPSNLPAKTAEEEHRHREEYKQMVAAAKKKEAQNSVARQKQQQLQLQQEEQLAVATKHFSQNVLPNWETMHNTRKTRDMWWHGLPSSVRGKVWELAIGNDLNLTQQLYEICLQRAQNRLNSPDLSYSETDVDQESSMDVIQLDISRTFPQLCIFQEGGPYFDVLHSLLAAYVCYRPDVGYVQGMSFIAAILILNMDELDAFVCFANLLNRPLHLAAFTLNQLQMHAYYNAYNEIFSYNLPRLYSHFQRSGLTPDLYLLDWIYTIFAKAMPLDIACRVWDLFLRDGDEFLFRTALGILHLNQDQLIHMDFLHGAQFLTRLPDDLSSDHLFKSIQTVYTNIGKQTFNQIVERYKNTS